MPASPCSVCESLGSSYVARTGYGESFPDAYRQLKKQDFGLSEELLRCPACDAVFHWEDHTQLFGSGNLDEESLTRLPEDQAQVVRDLLRLPDPAISAPELLQRTFGILPSSVRGLVMGHLRNSQKEAFMQLLPSLIDRLHDTNEVDLRTFLTSYCYDGNIRCAAVLKMVEENPKPKNAQCGELAAYCRKSLRI